MTPRFPDVTVTVNRNATHQENRRRVIIALDRAGYQAAVVDFINDVARATRGRINRSRWIGVAETYVHLDWTD